jgi:hypothetical protein
MVWLKPLTLERGTSFLRRLCHFFAFPCASDPGWAANSHIQFYLKYKKGFEARVTVIVALGQYCSLLATVLNVNTLFYFTALQTLFDVTSAD